MEHARTRADERRGHRQTHKRKRLAQAQAILLLYRSSSYPLLRAQAAEQRAGRKVASVCVESGGGVLVSLIAAGCRHLAGLGAQPWLGRAARVLAVCATVGRARQSAHETACAHTPSLPAGARESRDQCSASESSELGALPALAARAAERTHRPRPPPPLCHSRWGIGREAAHKSGRPTGSGGGSGCGRSSSGASERVGRAAASPTAALAVRERRQADSARKQSRQSR